MPFLGKDGYMADVTRHGDDAPGNVVETIIYEAFQVFKDDKKAENTLLYSLPFYDDTNPKPSKAWNAINSDNAVFISVLLFRERLLHMLMSPS